MRTGRSIPQRERRRSVGRVPAGLIVRSKSLGGVAVASVRLIVELAMKAQLRERVSCLVFNEQRDKILHRSGNEPLCADVDRGVNVVGTARSAVLVDEFVVKPLFDLFDSSVAWRVSCHAPEVPASGDSNVNTS
jgi:hypothetical protein